MQVIQELNPFVTANIFFRKSGQKIHRNEYITEPVTCQFPDIAGLSFQKMKERVEVNNIQPLLKDLVDHQPTVKKLVTTLAHWKFEYFSTFMIGGKAVSMRLFSHDTWTAQLPKLKHSIDCQPTAILQGMFITDTCDSREPYMICATVYMYAHTVCVMSMSYMRVTMHR